MGLNVVTPSYDCKNHGLVFEVGEHRKIGRRTFPYCRICSRERSSAYYHKNLEKCREKNRKYVINNEQRLKEWRRKYYQKHREERIEYVNKWQAENRGKKLANKKRVYQKAKNTISDGFVKKRLTNRNGLSSRDLPADLIKSYRYLYQIKKLLRSNA